MIKQTWGDNHSSSKKYFKKTGKNLVETLQQAGELPGEFKKAEEKQKGVEKRHREQIFHLKRIQKEGQEIWSQHERQTRLEIEVLQEEVAALAQQTEGISKQLEVAAQQPIINPNVSDISFLRSLRDAIKNFRQKIEDASVWVAALGQKSKRLRSFWGVFASKKGGAGFLLSSEHYVSRSAG